MPPRPTPLRYVLAWLLLVALAGLSFGLSRVSLGAWGTVVALAIAVLKAVVVLRAFMHLGREADSVRLLSWLTLAGVTLLCLGVMADVGLR
jgi:caa(3)-type oxidase subunit IV